MEINKDVPLDGREIAKAVAREMPALLRSMGGLGEPKDLTLEAGGFEILAADPPDSSGKPALTKFRMTAYTGSQMRLGSWGNPVIVDLAGIKIPTQKLPIRFGHDPDSGVGHTTTIAIEEGKLVATGVVSRDTPEAREVVASAKNGFPWQLSIGASAEETEQLREGDSAEINGKKVRGPLSLVRRSTLGEISFVDLGADRKTTANIAAKAAKESTMPDDGKTDENKIVEAGKVETPSEKKEEIKMGGHRNPTADEMVAEAYRRQAIDNMTIAAMADYQDDPEECKRLQDLGAHHVDARTPVKDFEIILIRERRPVGINGRRGADRGIADTLTAAATLSAFGDEAAYKAHGERTVEAARKRFGTDIGLQEIMLQAARANGYHGRDRVTVGNWREVWAYASGGNIQASGFSTVNLPYVLGNVANKAIAKVAADPAWIAPRICGTASHSNFHSHTVLTMGVNGTIEQVGPGGEIKHARLSEETYTRQVSTRGAILRLSRTDIVNDDMGMFTANAQMLVRKAYNGREKVLFTLINASGAGSSHFTSARGNYVSGATTVAGTQTGMDAAVKAFRLLKDLDSDPVGVEPAFTLVGPIYEAAMNTLLGAAVPSLILNSPIHDSDTAIMQGATNIYSGRFGGKTLCSPWIESTAAGGSASGTCWYLFADPQVLPCYEIAYLNGATQPTVEYFGLDSDADTLGVAWRIYWDFGVAAANWRGGVKIAGA